MYPRTMASTGKTFSFFTIMLLSFSWSTYGLTFSGRLSREDDMKWFGQISDSNENQNSESAVSSLPLFGIPYNAH